VLALNNAHAAELSWLDNDRLTLLLRQAFHAVDRVVVAPGARGRGHAGLLYADLFDRAGHSIVVCEVNRDPPNHA
jgi:predicted GNAT superfamily acetyltransferase